MSSLHPRMGFRAAQRRLTVGKQCHPNFRLSFRVTRSSAARTSSLLPQGVNNQASTSGGSSPAGNNSVSSASEDAGENGQPTSWIASNSKLARKLLSAENAAEVEELLMEARHTLTSADCSDLLTLLCQKGNTKLALSVHSAMRAALTRRSARTSLSSYEDGFSWPAATIQTTSSLVLDLCREVAIVEAVRVVADIRVPVPRSEEVGFGKVITSPLATNRTLTVVQPREGFKLVADAYSKYEYEVFTGTVVSCTSEAMESQANSFLWKVAQAVGLRRNPPAAAVHTVTTQAPDGTSRTFRFATETANVPAQVGERLTMVCAPFKNSKKGSRAFFSATPPGRKAGEAMQATNHRTGVVTPLLPPPAGAQGAIPAWVLPVVVVLAGSDAASSLIDPALPAMIAAGSMVAIGTVATSTNVVVPKLKQLSDRDVSMEYMRQTLLGQYALIAGKSDEIGQEAHEDIRILARLWQLQNKMESVGQTAAAYEARITRIAQARENIEARLSKKLELLDGYARVMNMIEIELEMDMELPAAELEGIEMQLARLQELEGLQDDWRVQAEARDEVERLLRVA